MFNLLFGAGGPKCFFRPIAIRVCTNSAKWSRPIPSRLETTLDISQPCWLALRTPPQSVPDDPDLKLATPLNEFGRELVSHTSPVYVTVAGRKVFDSAVGRDLLEKMKKGRAMIVEKGRFDDDPAKAQVLDVYSDGVAVLERRMPQ